MTTFLTLQKQHGGNTDLKRFRQRLYLRTHDTIYGSHGGMLCTPYVPNYSSVHSSIYEHRLCASFIMSMLL